MESDAALLKFIMQLLVSFASLLGVYVVFRLNSAAGAINNSFVTLDNSLDNLGNSIKQYPPREKLKVVLKWVGDPNDPIRGRIEIVDEILRDVFNQVNQKKLIINTFCGILISCYLVFEFCLLKVWMFPLYLFFLFSILIGILFMFPVWALKNTTDWKYWGKVRIEWQKVYASIRR